MRLMSFKMGYGNFRKRLAASCLICLLAGLFAFSAEAGPGGSELSQDKLLVVKEPAPAVTQKYEKAIGVLSQSIELFRNEGKNALDEASRQATVDGQVSGQAAQVLQQAVANSTTEYNTTLANLESRLNKLKTMQGDAPEEGRAMVALMAEVNGTANELDQGLNGMLDKLGEAYQRAYSMSGALGAVKRAEFNKKVILDKFADVFRQLRELKQSITTTLLSMVEQEQQLYRQKTQQTNTPKAQDILSAWGMNSTELSTQLNTGGGLGLGWQDNSNLLATSFTPLNVVSTNQLGSFNYSSWDGWNNTVINSGTNNNNNMTASQNQLAVARDIATAGMVTPADAVPSHGFATYRGTISGNSGAGGLSGGITLIAFYDNRTISGSYSLNNSSGSTWADGRLRGTWLAGGTAINGTISSTNGMNGTIDGSFRGTQAQSVRGNWNMSGGGNSGSGTFTAQK